MTGVLTEVALDPRRAASGTAPRSAVLVVDDIPANLTAMEALLSELSCETVLVRSGNEALLQLLKRDFAVMLLDVQMPEMDGYEVARYARDNPATREVPIVFLTAGSLSSGVSSRGAGARGSGKGAGASSDTDESVLRAYGSGAVDFLLKPVNPQILRSKVRVFLELHERRRQAVDASKALETANRELREAVLAKAALADRFQQANLDLERAYADLKAAQAGLIQSAKMASLGELVAGIAHEINNPLAFCVSHLETVRRSLGHIDPSALDLNSAQKGSWERAHTRLNEMVQGLGRITDLVLKLRAFSRLDEGSRKQVNVKECVDAVLTILRHRYEPRIDVAVEFGEPAVIECHPGLFNQALMNLVSNAIDAIEGEGQIRISSGGADDVFRLAVEDTGPGIDPALRERIFEPFFTTKPVGKGTGLGLSIAYSVVQTHGGRLEVQSAPGGGTRMVMQVPIESGRRESK